MDIRIIKFFNRLGQGTSVDLLTRAVSNISFLGILWIALAVLVFFGDKNDGHKIAFTMTIAAGFHFLLTAGILKRGLGHYHKKIRPYISYPGEIRALGRLEVDSSFPSNHMSANMAPLAVLVYFYPSIWAIAFIWISLMAFARLHNGMHFLSDVAAGILLGILYGYLSIYLTNYYVLS